MQIRPATRDDVHAIARLALIAGEGIPAWFWARSASPGQAIEDVGAALLLNENANFSCRNAHVAESEGDIAGMILAYRLPDAGDAEDLNELPGFIRPLVELEQCVPASFYINMIATFPEYRNRSIGTQLMAIVDNLAKKAGCTLSSIEVFDQNEGALRLYKRLGYRVLDQRPVVPHECHPYDGQIVLLTRPVAS